MEVTELIRACSDPAAYPYPVGEVEVHQTHISVVFLAAACAYKFKKPLRLDFLDYSTLDKRRHFCGEEVRLNRRLAPEVYLGVVPLARTRDGLRLEGQGEAVEWAVKMRRLPECARLDEQLRCGGADAAWVERVACRIAAFHRQAEAAPAVSACGRFAVVAQNARENLTQVGAALSRRVWERLRTRTEEGLASLRPLMEDRAARGVPRDTHGDLRLDHVYLFPGRPPPHDLAVVDCIEFSERFRFADPVADVAFLAMDLVFHGRRALAGSFADAYFHASGDRDGRALLPFYTAYRAAVRGKVEGIEAAEKEVPPAEREAALARARAHWLLALGELEAPAHRPCLVLVGGLPGAGKSTLAEGLARHADCDVVRSDAVRKELAGPSAQDGAHSPFGEGIYTPEWNERTYAACLRRVGELLFEGKRVLVDASFREERCRRAFLEAATGWGVPGVFLLCRAEPDVVKGRLDARRGGVSDADWAVYREAARRWEEVGRPVQPFLREVPSGGSRGQTLRLALAVLRELRLAD
jgi:aminoglycoside phosphotransferase family enzyme/predicted kinase